MALLTLLALFSWTLFLAPVSTGSLADIDHVVLLMQENRAFDHYFGTMAGVRGFSDPNVQITNGKPVWYQDINSTLTNATDYLLPFYLNYLGGSWEEATQCMIAGDNGWNDNHAALNDGLNNKWALNNTPWSWGHFTRKELPIHFALAEGWTVADMYQQSVIASTNPNRVSWISGSINAPGGPQTPDEGGVTIDNNETPGCEAPDLNCYPLKWKTVPEFYQQEGVTWQIYQDIDNFDDNPLACFAQYQTAPNNTELAIRGMAFLGLDTFYAQAAAGTLPEVSYIVGPTELSEHPPYQPEDGAWLQKQVAEAVINSPKYKNTVLMISWDETGGFGDHVVPYHSPTNTPGEWIEDPYGKLGDVYTGPGSRLPFYIISPWTRGGNVFVENADHISQIKFIEQWQFAKGTNQIPSWRRTHMSDLVNAFDFDHPDYSLPSIPSIANPSVDNTTGIWNGYAVCEALYPVQRLPVPYGQQTQDIASYSEQGFKVVRGDLTEGRYLVFEQNGYALTNSGDKISATRATPQHDSKSQRWIGHQLIEGTPQFTFSSAVDGKYINAQGQLVDGNSTAVVVTVKDLGNGKGLAIQSSSGCLTIDGSGEVSWSKNAVGFATYSVTYSN